MLKVKLTFKTPKAIIKDGKPVVEYDVVTENHIVASTKSFNNLIDDLKLENKIATETATTELFIDKAKTTKAIADYINTEISDKDVAKYVIEHCVKALDGACVFKKPPVVRKK